MRERAEDGDEELIERTPGCALVVHRELGPGLVESVYEAALAVELAASGIAVCRQVPVGVTCRGADLGIGSRADLLVEERLLLEIRSVDGLKACTSRRS